MKNVLRCRIGTGAIGAVGVALALCLAGCVSVDLASLLYPELRESVVVAARGATRSRILLVDISGFIGSGSGSLSLLTGCTPDSVRAVLDKAEGDGRIRALILRIDTPGGGVAATDLIRHDIERFRERTGCPVVAMFMGTACSGGYFIGSCADRIYAQPSTVTGSIGVVAVFPRLEGLTDKIGIDQVVVKSGDFKDMGNPLREMSAEERALFQRMIDHFHSQFLQAVADGREAFAEAEQVAPVADGRVYTAAEAQSLGLVDAVGYLDDAIVEAKALAGLDDAAVITYTGGPTPNPTVYSSRAAHGPGMSLINVDLGPLAPLSKAGFYYLWLPGQ